MIRVYRTGAALSLAAVIVACGGGGSADGGSGGPTVSNAGCSGGCAAATPSALAVSDVNRILSQAVREAQARGSAATIAVVDRSGNVLGVFEMTGAAATFRIDGGRSVVGGLEGVAIVPSAFAAISKAITGAYLSSEGNAFSTRTASQIIQENFNPGETGSPGGPLFGVQFSSLSCSDVVAPAAGSAGPKPAPLGLAADPGGLPLYRNGVVVGGIGVIADARYGLDLDINDVDQDLDESIAVAGMRGFDAPANRRADRITADGRTFRFVDSDAILSNPAVAPSSPPAGSGKLIAVPEYTQGVVKAGVAFGTVASGFRADASTPAFAGLGAYVLDDGAGGNRFPPIAGTDNLLTQAEVARVLADAMRIANRLRAQIRLPLGTAAQVSISVVDTNARVLGLIRSSDAPVFGTDVAVQKARTALLFSQPSAASALNAIAQPVFPPPLPARPTLPIARYVTDMQRVIPGALSDGVAYTSRAVGNLARPFLPDGINGSGDHGPLSKPFNAWSPFSDGLQLDLVFEKIVGNIVAGSNTGPCSPIPAVANGIQIFPGAVPIFRGPMLVGAIGVSGDGIDQDDAVAFLGLANAGVALGSGIGNAPAARRADQISVPGGRLRYVSCPIAPFLDTTDTNVCNGI